MATTPQSLLERLRRQPADGDWRRLDDVYRPLVLAWLARVPGIGDEARDVAQEVLLVVARELPGFERRREGSFRRWLRVVTVNRVRAYLRDRARRPDADEFLDRLADPASELSARWDRDHDRHVLDRLLAAVRGDVSPETWEAFRRFALDGRPAAAVAAELGTTENAVLLAKARILKRLREEAGGLID